MDLVEQSYVVEVLDINKEQIENNECVICMTNRKNCAFYPCGHQCLCKECSDRFKKEARHQVCPICRNRVQDIIRVYKWKLTYQNYLIKN